MRTKLRGLTDRAFTMLAGASVVLLAAALVAILGPMLWTGSGAIFFRGTVEFRKMQVELFERGDAERLDVELEQARQVRRPMYDLLDNFKRGIDTSGLEDQTKDAYRDFKSQLLHQTEIGAITRERENELRAIARRLRNALLDAYETTDKNEALRSLAAVLDYDGKAELVGTKAERFFELAEGYRRVVETVDLSRREEYAAALQQVQEIVRELFGPRPDEPTPELDQFRYGATRWDQVERLLDDLLWEDKWVPAGSGEPMRKTRVRRAEFFAGTRLAELFPLVEENVEAMFLPRREVYWQFFVDDSTTGHFHGGVGPEVLGTLLLTLLAMLFAVPVGVTSAAFLIECTSENLFVRVIRTCINTLAGVPSIVFGLFGLAFFVLWFQPAIGVESKSSILAGSLTLSVLILPVIIRASEEAIRAVPVSYKQASLALGASSFRTFMTVTLPAALPGILTGIILSMSRAAGETAPILFTAAVAVGPVPESILEPTRTLSYGSYDIATGDVVGAKVPHNQYGMITTLILLVLVLNVGAIVIRSRVARKLRGQ